MDTYEILNIYWLKKLLRILMVIVRYEIIGRDSRAIMDVAYVYFFCLLVLDDVVCGYFVIPALPVQATEIVECIRNSGTDIMVGLLSLVSWAEREQCAPGTMQARI